MVALSDICFPLPSALQGPAAEQLHPPRPAYVPNHIADPSYVRPGGYCGSCMAALWPGIMRCMFTVSHTMEGLIEQAAHVVRFTVVLRSCPSAGAHL